VSPAPLFRLIEKPRNRRGSGFSANSDGSIAVELYFVLLRRTFGQLLDREAEHWLDEMCVDGVPPFHLALSSVPISYAAPIDSYRSRARNVESHEFSQSALEAYFGRRPALRLQPPLEVLHANFVLNLPDNDRDRRLAAAYVVYPIVLAKHPQALSHCFVK
jgi:hypothetical protein